MKATFCRLQDGVWGVRLARVDETERAPFPGALVDVTKRDGTTKTCTLVSRENDGVVRGAPFEVWRIAEEKRAYAGRRYRLRRVEQASLASQTAPYALAPTTAYGRTEERRVFSPMTNFVAEIRYGYEDADVVQPPPPPAAAEDENGNPFAALLRRDYVTTESAL